MNKKALFLIVLALSFLLLNFMPQASATVIFGPADFEETDFSEFTGTTNGNGGALSVQDAIKYEGSYAAEFVQGGAGGWAVAYENFGSTYPTAYAQTFLRVTALPSSGERQQLGPVLFEGASAAHILGGLFLYNDGGTVEWDLQYRTDATEENHAYSSSPTPTVDTWYRVEIKVLADGSVGEVKAWIVVAGNNIDEDSPTISATSLNNNDYEVGRLEVGTFSTADTGITCYHDYVQVADAYIGPEEGGEPQNVIVDLSETCAVTASLYSQKSLYRVNSETVTIVASSGTQKTITKISSITADVSCDSATQKALNRLNEESLSVSASSGTRKTLTRVEGETTVITVTLESEKSITEVFAELLETCTVTASLSVTKALHFTLAESLIISELLDVTKHMAATLVELAEQIVISISLATVLPTIPLTAEEAAAIGIVFAIVVLAVCVGLIFARRKPEE